jgi:hypothetical protein
MIDLSKLAQSDVRDALLLAEVAAWLHNAGKLDPNFVGSAPKELLVEGYRYQRFAAPDIIQISDSGLQILFQQNLDADTLNQQVQAWINNHAASQKLEAALVTLYKFTKRHGPLYFVELEERTKIRKQQETASLDEYVDERISQHIQEWKQQYPDGWERLLEKRRAEYHQERQHELEREWGNLLQREERDEKDREQEWRSLELALPGTHIRWSLADLLTLFWDDFFEKPDSEHYNPGTDDDPDYKRTYLLQDMFPNVEPSLPALLVLSHGEVSGQEKKGLTIDDRYCERDEDHRHNRTENLQSYSLDNLRLSTAFGYEPEGILNWLEWPKKRRHVVESVPVLWRSPAQERVNFDFSALKEGMSDARLPFNEISLLDYVEPIAALFKSAIAQGILTEQMPTPANMRWRLVSIRLDAFDFLFQASQLSDLLARRQLLSDAHKLIRHVLEVEVPVGSEVYADEHGSVFVLPEIPGWSSGQIRDALISCIHPALDNPELLATLQSLPTLYGASDLRPGIYVGPPQRGKRLNLQETLPEEEIISSPPPQKVEEWWKEAGQRKDMERCTVCGLRPAGYVEPDLPGFVKEDKAKERHLCGVCLARRGRRAQNWANTKSDETVWVDEVADVNGRVALVVGRFDLDDWLSGDLVRSLAVGTDEHGNWLSKPPAFARIHRVWRTTADFWKGVQTEIHNVLKDDRRRLLLSLDKQPDLGDYHVYELLLGPTKMSVVWVPSHKGQEGHFISADNLKYTASQLGAKQGIHKDSAVSSIFVEDFIEKEFLKNGRQPMLQNPEGKFSEREKTLLRGCKITRTAHQDVAYSTAIPILAEPRTFMALVPADRALEVVRAIKAKYEREMGKVRNRLPLHLGVVYAHRRTPLRAVLDAGRRMLKQKAFDPIGEWRVVANVVKQTGPLPEDAGDLAEGTQQFDAWYAVKLENQALNRTLTWYVPAVMGDGHTKDQWYPYVFLKTDAEPGDCGRRFQAPNPWTGRNGWVVHAGDLKAGDVVYFTPATLDFQWLDSAACRFEIAYHEDGRRRELPRRPYLLDEMDTLECIWQTLKHHLTKNQIYALRDLVEAKWEEWDIAGGEGTFRQFCRDALANAEWRKGRDDYRREKYPWQAAAQGRDEWLDTWADYAARGWLADAIELHLQIMKEEVVS